MMQISIAEVLGRAAKYLVEGIVVAIAAFVIPAKSMRIDEVSLIALTAAATFAILDVYSPGTYGEVARSAAGFGIGANLVGFPRSA
jgi:hypothetical protein